MASPVLDDRQLNRALLERQMLLRRRRVSVPDAVERLIGLQAQVPRDPYVALWSRLDRFHPEALSSAIERRRAVRMPLLRGTLHLVTDRDAYRMYPAIGPVLHRLLYSGSPFGRRLEGVQVHELTKAAVAALGEEPRTRAELAHVLAKRWPDHDATALAYAVTYLLPLVQVPPRGLWGRSGRSAFTTLERWLGPAPKPDAGPDATPDAAPDGLVVRYLAAFGPATPADLAAWSGLQGAREILERLRPTLRTFRNRRGRELFDVPGGPLPRDGTPAPVRFLPEYDNVVLGHADRARIVPPGVRQWTQIGWGMVLVDGFTAARWKLDRDKDRATLRVEPFGKLLRSDRDEVGAEAQRLLAFLAGDSGARDIDVA